MTRIALGGLVIAHGLITLAIWIPPPSNDAPMQPSHSWLLGQARLTSLVIAVLAGCTIVVSGIGILTHHDWWVVAGMAGAALSLALYGLFFSPWWLIAIAISALLGAAACREWTEL